MNRNRQQQQRGGYNSGGYRSQRDDSRPARGGYGGGSSRGGGSYNGSSRGGFQSRAPSRAPIETNIPRPYDNTKVVTTPSSTVQSKANIDPDDMLAVAAPGTAGKKLSVVTNYFPVSLTKDPFHFYAVNFDDNEVRSKRLCSAVIAKAMGEGANYVYDGSGLLFSRMEKFEGFCQIVEHNGRNHDIEIKYVKTISSERINMELCQLFNIIYRASFRHLKLTPIGRNYFDLSKRFKIGEQLEIAPGQQQTLYKTQLGLLANRDVVWKILRMENCYDILMTLHNTYSNGDDVKREFENEVKNKVMFLPHLNRTTFVTGVAWNMKPSSTFKKNNKDITFEEYYLKTHAYEIKDRNQPMLECKKQNQQTSYFLPEMCRPTGLTDKMRADYPVMSALKDATGLSPDNRFKSVVHTINTNNQNKEFAKELEDNGYHAEATPIEVTARQLPAPAIIFGGGSEKLDQRSAEWNMNRKSLFRSIGLSNWAILYPPMSRFDDEDPKHEVNMFVETLKRCCSQCSIKFEDPEYIPVERNELQSYNHAIDSIMIKKSIILVVLPNKDKSRYDAVKLKCAEKNLLSQCVVWKIVQDNNMSKTTKIAIQMSTKIGAAPWALSFNDFKKSMIVGLDVHHSGEIGTKKKSSVVGFCATLGGDQTNYYSKEVVQSAGQEIVNALEPCMDGALQMYKKKNGVFPESVIFYRDGVGEGQVEEVHRVEIAAVKQAIRKLCASTKLVHVVVLKRINTRLCTFSGSNTMVNLPPGTVVDTDIISPKAMEFFLVAHSTTQGTATPTKYSTILNEANLSSDQLQQLTYHLCHNYYNWFGAIRSPSVCQNAHKLAFFVAGFVKSTSGSLSKFNSTLYYL